MGLCNCKLIEDCCVPVEDAEIVVAPQQSCSVREPVVVEAQPRRATPGVPKVLPRQPQVVPQIQSGTPQAVLPRTLQVRPQTQIVLPRTRQVVPQTQQVLPPQPRPKHYDGSINMEKTSTNKIRTVAEFKKMVKKNEHLLKLFLERAGVDNKNLMDMGNVYMEEQLFVFSMAYEFVMARFRNHKFNSNYEINRICKIWNPYLFLQYRLRKEYLKDTCDERYLFHGTDNTCATNIIMENFDWRKVVAKKFGQGVSFANNPWYASHYSVRRQRGYSDYVMILAKVLVERGGLSQGCHRTVVPPTGSTTTNPKGEVIVKYDDGLFYPEFIIYFRKRGYYFAY